MRSYRKELWFNVPARRGFINITSEVEACLAESGIDEGLVLVNAMHITASVFINDDESGLHKDYDDWLEGLAPHEPVDHYRHNRTGEDNGDAHLKNLLIHHQVIVPITNGRLDLGPWQRIFYAEFDGQRRKRLIITSLAALTALLGIAYFAPWKPAYAPAAGNVITTKVSELGVALTRPLVFYADTPEALIAQPGPTGETWRVIRVDLETGRTEPTSVDPFDRTRYLPVDAAGQARLDGPRDLRSDARVDRGS